MTRKDGPMTGHIIPCMYVQHRRKEKSATVIESLAVMMDNYRHHTTTVLRPFSGTTPVSRCQKRTSGLYDARGD